MSYSNATTGTYIVRAGVLTSAAVIGQIMPPAGKSGRLISISTIVTTAVTGAAASVEVGVSGDTDGYGLGSVAVSSIGAAVNATTDGVTNVIPADTVVDIYTDGGGTLGGADITVIIDWY